MNEIHPTAKTARNDPGLIPWQLHHLPLRFDKPVGEPGEAEEFDADVFFEGLDGDFSHFFDDSHPALVDVFEGIGFFAFGILNLAFEAGDFIHGFFHVGFSLFGHAAFREGGGEGAPFGAGEEAEDVFGVGAHFFHFALGEFGLVLFEFAVFSFEFEFELFEFAVVGGTDFGDFGITARAGGLGTEGTEVGLGEVGASVDFEGLVGADGDFGVAVDPFDEVGLLGGIPRTFGEGAFKGGEAGLGNGATVEAAGVEGGDFKFFPTEEAARVGFDNRGGFLDEIVEIVFAVEEANVSLGEEGRAVEDAEGLGVRWERGTIFFGGLR